MANTIISGIITIYITLFILMVITGPFIGIYCWISSAIQENEAKNKYDAQHGVGAYKRMQNPMALSMQVSDFWRANFIFAIRDFFCV